ncbi:Membrane bound L-sorbosone dehydrogenase [Lignipirellula cremea]|uniref:Membrane bound L-sorbosone dehydrogenase n=2 Tax=Lignipirellula cremea TaxID=2528010 RepID=A0A518DUK6_9BACT|nr:Membrane bound L-sorbosone dehydrogenase [Lignipirellula cremea]
MLLRTSCASLLFLLLAIPPAFAGPPTSLELQQGDTICLVGNTLAEREQYFGYVEARWHARFPQMQLSVRNMGWSADELDLRPRSKDFGTNDEQLRQAGADVVLAFFGFNESFQGPDGVAAFQADLAAYLKHLRSQKYNGETAPRIALVSPIPFENLGVANLPDGAAVNENLKLYTAAMAETAAAENVPFVDLFTPVLAKLKTPKTLAPRAIRNAIDLGDGHWTFNGVHLTDNGYRQLAPILDEGLFGAWPAGATAPSEDLLAAVQEKDFQWFHKFRAVNGFYIYGGRKNPFGVRSFPQEMEKLVEMTALRDRRIWDIAQGKAVPAAIDDAATTQLAAMETNYDSPITLLSPDDALKSFTVAEGYVVECFASEVEFPDLQNPVQFTFDGRGRLWVCTMPSYPQYLPPYKPNDKLLILEDTDGDGKADKQTVFADGLHIPTGFELGDGGVYVAQQPNLVFLQDTDGDDKADRREIVLEGFDTADSHHSISAFTWGPGGGLYFQEGTFHHTQVETPYGPDRCVNAGVFRYEPTTQKFETFVSYSFANPWGHTFDKWGQNFVADASPGFNYVGAAFSGHIDYPHKHGTLKQFLVKRVRPTCGCEFVSSRQFPAEAQGNYLLNNTIGVQGVLQHKVSDDGSGFKAVEIEPLLLSSDRNFRPTDLQFGPDGALYVVDWFNPLIGHMQHSLRDPNRDHSHGRIWRVRYEKNDLLQTPELTPLPLPQLLDQLKAYEDRTRYRARRALRERPTDDVMAALEVWLGGLDKNDAEYPHHQLEALWVCQHHNVVHKKLLEQVLRSPDYRARAAATRVLCYWRDQLENPLELLKVQATDEHPRVRLEAVRACSFFRTPEALEVALESAALEQDDYLAYTFEETIKQLERALAE